MIADLLSTLIGPLGAILAGIVAVVGALVLGRRQGRQAAQDKAATTALGHERKRQEQDDDIQQDTDLAARARRSGIVRPDR